MRWRPCKDSGYRAWSELPCLQVLNAGTSVLGTQGCPWCPGKRKPKVPCFTLSLTLPYMPFSWAVFLSVSFKTLQSPGYMPGEIYNSLVLGYQHHKAFSMHEALCYIRQVSLLPWANACVPLKFICWKPNPQSDDFRWWDHLKIIRLWVQNPHEGRAHMNAIRALVKEAWNTGKSLLFRDMSWKRPSLTLACWHPDLGLLASRSAVNNMVYKPPILWHFVTAACML